MNLEASIAEPKPSTLPVRIFRLNERDVELVRLLNGGKPKTDIMNIMDYSKPALSHAIRRLVRHGVLEEKKPKITDEQVIEYTVQKMMTPRQIAKRHRLSMGTVISRVRKLERNGLLPKGAIEITQAAGCKTRP